MTTKEPLSDDLVIVNSTSNDDAPPSCCLCLDVRSGTVFIGLCNLVMHAAGLIAASRMLVHYHQHMRDTNAYYGYHYHAVAENHNVVGLCLAALMFLITLMLIYGAITRQSNLLLPFFFLQVFDMGLFVMGTAGISTYGGHLKIALQSNPRFAYHDVVARMNTANFLLMLTVICVGVIIVKGYMLCCVWNCYKHTRSYQLRFERMQPMLFLGSDLDHQVLLPSYEDIIKEAPRQDQQPPPPYTPITTNSE